MITNIRLRSSISAIDRIGLTYRKWQTKDITLLVDLVVPYMKKTYLFFDNAGAGIPPISLILPV